MKTLGLIGGTSWHSSVEYYQTINSLVNSHFGNNTNPPLILFNLNQALVHAFQKQNDWQSIAKLITNAAQRLAAAGADTLLFCANTPHKVYELVQTNVSIPILHIADATAQFIQNENVNKVCFIGTEFSMEQEFIIGRIRKAGIEVSVPSCSETRVELHRIIQEELAVGKTKQHSKQYVVHALNSMLMEGAEGIVLGCTEFPLLVSQADFSVPVFDTTTIHSKAAVEYILSSEL